MADVVRLLQSPPPEINADRDMNSIHSQPSLQRTRTDRGTGPQSNLRLWWLIPLLPLLALLYFAGRVLLLGFAGLLLAVLLNAASRFIERWTPLTYRWSLCAVVTGFALLAGLFIWRLEAQIAQQIEQFQEAWPASLQIIRNQLERFELDRWLSQGLPQSSAVMGGQSAMTQVTGIASTALGVVVDLLVVLFVGLYFAAEPGLYKRGIRHLVPQARRERADEVLHCVGSTLRWWIVGKLCSMAIVGTLTGVGLWILGIQLALLLGLLAAILELIPNFGPTIAAVPAILIAWTESSQLALYVAVLYGAIQVTESYVILPLIQRRAVELPPALVILAVVLLGVLAGVLGALVAAPLVAAMLVLIKMLYVEDFLGDRSAHVIGDGA